MSNTINESTRRAHQIAYDNRAPAEGEWCEGYDVNHCYLGTENNVTAVMRPDYRPGRGPDAYTYCPTCRAKAARADLAEVESSIADAIRGLPVCDAESHRVTTLRATLSAALREVQAERASWEAQS